LSATPLSFRHSPTTVALIPIDVSLVTWSIIKDLSGDITSTVPKWSKCSLRVFMDLRNQYSPQPKGFGEFRF
jgi:hypothetical protein